MSSVFMHGADSPTTGAYKNNDVAEIFKPAAYASLLFDIIGKRKTKSGDTVTVPAYENLTFPTSTILDEDDLIPLSKLSVTAKTIATYERGRAVAVTGKTINRAPIDILGAHKDAVQMMMTRELEEVIGTAMKTMPIKYVLASATTQTITTNGTAGGAAGSQPNFYHAQTIGTYLNDNLRIPMHAKYGAYVGIFRGNGLLGIKRDSEWRTAFQGQGLSPVAQLAVQGKIGEIVFLAHNDSRVLSNAIGTGSAFSEGFVVGADPALFAFIEQIRLVYDFSETFATNFGRFKYIAWLGDYGAGLYSDSANADLVRGVHISST